MKNDTGEGYTYILERKEAKMQRRFYVGRTNNLERRMKEHQKDRYKDYVLIWSVYGQFEKSLKNFGATKFMALEDWDRKNLVFAFNLIRRLKKKNEQK